MPDLEIWTLHKKIRSPPYPTAHPRRACGSAIPPGLTPGTQQAVRLYAKPDRHKGPPCLPNSTQPPKNL